MLHLLLFSVFAPSALDIGEAGAQLHSLRVLSVSGKRSAGETKRRAIAHGDRPVMGPEDHPPALTVPDSAPSLTGSFPVAVPPAVAPGDGAAYAAPSAVSGPSVIPASRGSTAEDSRSSAQVADGYADALRGYRVALALQAKRFRLYPAAAEEMGLGGRSEIEVLVPAGATPELRIKQSSGHELLDRAALEMLRRSIGSVELPPSLRGHGFAFSLPVEFVPPR